MRFDPELGQKLREFQRPLDTATSGWRKIEGANETDEDNNDDEENDENETSNLEAELAAMKAELAAIKQLLEEHYQVQ